MASGSLAGDFLSLCWGLHINRDNLRRALRRKRRALSSEDRQQRAQAISEKAASLSIFRNSHHIAFYIADDGEVDPSYLLKSAYQLGKSCYLPVLSADASTHGLAFYTYHIGDVLVNNRFGIPEPNLLETSHRTADCLDLVFLPLVAFDHMGHRLGRGGGCYDSTFAFLANVAISTPTLIGLSYEFQHLDEITPCVWDIPLNIVVTETAVYTARE